MVEALPPVSARGDILPTLRVCEHERILSQVEIVAGRGDGVVIQDVAVFAVILEPYDIFCDSRVGDSEGLGCAVNTTVEHGCVASNKLSAPCSSGAKSCTVTNGQAVLV